MSNSTSGITRRSALKLAVGGTLATAASQSWDGTILAADAAGSTPSPASGFRVSFDPAIRKEPFSGRIVLFFSQSKLPRRSMNWFHPEPMLSCNVVDLRPGESVTLSLDAPTTLRFPATLTAAALQGLTGQAVARFNDWERRVGDGPGNGFSAPAVVDLNGEFASFTINQLENEGSFPELKWSRLFEVHSPLLSQFHGRPVSVRSTVLLPASYFDQPQRKFPTIFSIPGFGGTHLTGVRPEPVAEQNPQGVEFLRVLLDPSCPLGHHVFADSANNGPWGRALVEEFLPAYEAEFRTIAAPRGRLLTGHSSGGWSSFWLQLTHPETFGGTWSTAPDPVDFRDFQQINIYRKQENMFTDATGKRRPLARFGEKVALWYDDFCHQEGVLGPGGQLHSFEAVFSPRGTDGRPQLLWDRTTGAIDLETASAWKEFDINLVLQSRWQTLRDSLQGKLHLFMGGADTFYLDGATRLLKSTLTELGSDAVVEVFEGKDHGSLMTRELRDRIRTEMALRSLRAD